MEYIAGVVMSSNLISISEDRSIEVAESLMKINNIRHLPVVNSKNELAGIISAKDVMQAKDKKNQIRSAMNKSVRFVNKTDSIKSIIELMLRDKINSILVMDERNVVGIVTTDDLLKMLMRVISDYENLDEISRIKSFFDESWVG